MLTVFFYFGAFFKVKFAHSTSPRAYFDFAVFSIDKKNKRSISQLFTGRWENRRVNSLEVPYLYKLKGPKEVFLSIILRTMITRLP